MRCLQPHGEQEGALRHGGVHDAAALLQRMAELLEIDMRGEVAFARLADDVGEAMAAHGLQRVAGRTVQVAIVDDEGRAFVLRPASRRCGGRSPRARARPRRRRRPCPAGPGTGPESPQARWPFSSPTMRSCQRAFAHLDTGGSGMASKNSLASRIIGPSGTSSSVMCQLAPMAARCAGAPAAPGSSRRGAAARRRRKRRREPCARCAARRPSACRGRGPVPRG